nr:MAG TPA: hypothetical protein [Caudoviricetes sp.]
MAALQIKRPLEMDTILRAVAPRMEQNAAERRKAEAAKASVNRELAKGGKWLRVL